MKNQNLDSVIDKSKVLMPYWIKHNNEHMAHYKKWLKGLKDAGLNDIAEDVKKVIQHSEEINKCTESAIKKLQITKVNSISKCKYE